MTKIIIIYILIIILILLINTLSYVDTFENSSEKQNYAFIKKPDERNPNTSKDGFELEFDDYNNQHNIDDIQKMMDLYNKKRTTYDFTSSDADDYYNPKNDTYDTRMGDISVHTSSSSSNSSSSSSSNSLSNKLYNSLSNNLYLYIIIVIFCCIFIK